MSTIDLDSIFELSHLDVSSDQKQSFEDQIQKIVDYMDVLKQVPSTVPVSAHWPLNQDNVTRSDNPISFSHPLVEENAPEFQDGGFWVPKIVS